MTFEDIYTPFLMQLNLAILKEAHREPISIVVLAANTCYLFGVYSGPFSAQSAPSFSLL